MMLTRSIDLCYETDPFEWELVKCVDGKTKVKINQENDVNKDWEKEKIKVKEEIKKRIVVRDPQVDEANEEFDNEENIESRERPLIFKEKKDIIHEFFNRNFDVLSYSNGIVRMIGRENEKKNIVD
jgi:hypothetical protein